MPSSLHAWVLAARPKTLWAGVAPVIIGIAMAVEAGAFHWPSALAALVGALLIQIGTNFANDYYDWAKGTDTAARIGPTRATQSGLIAPRTMKVAMILTFALVFIPGAYILYRGGWPFLAIGVVSIVCGILYTGGPYPLGYVGLGDLFVLIFFGPVAVGGTYYLQALNLPSYVIVAGLAPGFFSVAILTVNNLRDIAGDQAAGKKTLAVRFGARFARAEYLLSLLIACIGIPLYLALTQGRYWTLLSAATLLLAVPSIRTVYRQSDGAALNATLAATGMLLLVFSLLFSLGWNL
jgi:1,4-dihydroxy-2-naphthoate polyprenyltransferase